VNDQWQMDWSALGKRVRNRRLELGYTQEKLAELVEVSSSFIGTIERADKIPALITLAKLARCLDLSLDYLVFGTKTVCDGQNCSLYEDLVGVVRDHQRAVMTSGHEKNETDMRWIP